MPVGQPVLDTITTQSERETGRDRETETERQRQRETKRQRETQTETDRQTETETQRQRDRATGRYICTLPLLLSLRLALTGEVRHKFSISVCMAK